MFWDCKKAKLTRKIQRTMKAIWNGQIIAESDKTIVIEGNQYFPPDALKKEFFEESSTHTTCSSKGVASYFSVVVGGEKNKDAAWYYPDPKDAAKNIKGYVAFWRGVKVEAPSKCLNAPK